MLPSDMAEARPDSLKAVCNSIMVEDDCFADDPVALRAVRWHRQSGSNKPYVAPEKASLLRRIGRGDVNEIKKQVKSWSGKDLHDAEDEYGVSALQHAVRSGSTTIVDELLAVCTQLERAHAIERALLFAIKTNDIRMADHLINLHVQQGICRLPESTERRTTALSGTSDVISDENSIQLQMRNGRKWSQPRTLSTNSIMDETEFSQEMTPIVMAAQLERTEIIRMLLDRCSPDIHPLTRVPTTDHSQQSCYICKERANFVGRQTIEECRKAIEVYKALSSPAYMFQAGVEDPIREAFTISDVMERRKRVDPAFVHEYDAISLRCQKLAVDLLSLCRTCSETTALLSCDAGIEATHALDDPAFPRLMLALHFQQKEFIAHANCQQVLQNLWYKGLPEWVCQTSLHKLRAVTYVLILGLLMPFLFFMYMFRVPYVGRLLKPAVSKFIFDIFTYSVFLVLLYLNALLNRDHARGAALTETEMLILIHVLGYTARFLRQTIRRRGRLCGNYTTYNSTWRFNELFMLVFFLLYFGFKIGLWVQAMADPRVDPNINRRSWPWYDPFLWCEALYACASVLAVTQLYSFFKASSILGPLQITMKAMIYDVFPFLLLFIIVLGAFAVGLHSLYRGYPGMVRVDPATLHHVAQPDAFISLGNSMQTLFWDLFGYGDPEDGAVIVSNVNVSAGSANNTIVLEVGPIVRHQVAETVGFALHGIYHIIVIIVLLNMVIAMMAVSYNKIEGNAATEWRFARTRLILAYLNEIGVMAPPYNLLPIRWVLTRAFPCCHKFTVCQSVKTKPVSCIPYAELMERLSKRYWRTREGDLGTKTSHPSFRPRARESLA